MVAGVQGTGEDGLPPGVKGPDRSMHIEAFGELPGLAMRKWGQPMQMPQFCPYTPTAADLNLVLTSLTAVTALRPCSCRQ